jgi:cyclic pyranopterin monophosphate synthase
LPKEFDSLIQEQDLILQKGSVLQTAILAGTMAAKKTSELIPLCHAIVLSFCEIRTRWEKLVSGQGHLLHLTCEVKAAETTGVEMEALTGATVAALTVYDMCKGISHRVVLNQTKLLLKTGGRRTVLDKPLKGIVLTGGFSQRMKKDKALLKIQGQPQARVLHQILSSFCSEVFLSVREAQQWRGTELQDLPVLADRGPSQGPMSGLLSAFHSDPHCYWFVVACDLALVRKETLQELLFHFDPNTVATCFTNPDQKFPEALCAIYTPKARLAFEQAFNEKNLRCPVKVLSQLNCTLVQATQPRELNNVNTPEEFEKVLHEKNTT